MRSGLIILLLLNIFAFNEPCSLSKKVGVVRASDNLLLYPHLSASSNQRQPQLQIPVLQWQKSFGGSSIDDAKAVAVTLDGNYLVAGRGISDDGDFIKDPSVGQSNSPGWIVKINPQGNKLWSRAYSAFPNEPYSDNIIRAITATADGGCVVVGNAYPSSGSTYSVGWVFKLDAGGIKMWEKLFIGSPSPEYICNAVVIDTDGNYAIAGAAVSRNAGSQGNYAFWAVKLSPIGELIWQKTFGGSSTEAATSLVATADGGYVLAGFTASRDGDVTGTRDSFDYWILKIDANGIKVWQRTYGGSYDDRATSILKTPDGGFVIAGYASSGDGDVTGYHGPQPPVYGNTFFGYHDFWILKLNSVGALLWQKTLGGSGDDKAEAITMTSLGDLLVAGSTESADGDVTGYHPSPIYNLPRTDFWITKLTTTGVFLWQKTLGGSDDEEALSLVATPDGGCIAAGFANQANGDVTTNRGASDFWVVKLGVLEDNVCTTIADGLWDAPSVWSCGRVPSSGDIVQINHTIRLSPESPDRTKSIKYGSAGRLIFAAGSQLRF